MKKKITSLLAISSLIASGTINAKSNMEKAGDFGAVFLPAAALGMSLMEEGTHEGTTQFLVSWSASNLAVQGIKNVVDKRRPNSDLNETDDPYGNSFPSGHASAAFGGAAFIYDRYGTTWGIPAYALAAFTAYSRVDAQKHFYEDVLAGGSIAVMSSLIFTSPSDTGLSVSPTLNEGGGVGLQVAFTDQFFQTFKDAPINHAKDKDLKYRWEFIPIISNFKTTDISSDKDFEFVSSVEELETSAVRWFYDHDEKHSYQFAWYPYDVRGKATYQGAEEHSSFFSHDLTFGYQYALINNSSFSLSAGAALVLQHVNVELYHLPEKEELYDDSGDSITPPKNDEREVIAQDSEWNVYPMLTVQADYRISKNWSLSAEYGWGDLGSGYAANAAAMVSYQFNRSWDLGLGYSMYERENKDSIGFNNVQIDGGFFTIRL